MPVPLIMPVQLTPEHFFYTVIIIICLRVILKIIRDVNNKG